MKKPDRLILLILIFSFSNNVWASGLEKLKFKETEIQSDKEMDSLRPSLIKNIEASWNESRLSDDSYKIKLNFQNLFKYGIRRETFSRAREITKKYEDYYKQEEMLNAYSKIVVYQFDTQSLNIKKAHLEKLKKSLKSIKKTETSLINYVKLEEEIRSLENSIVEVSLTLKIVEDDFGKTYLANITDFPKESTIPLEKIETYLKERKKNPKKTLTAQILEDQLEINKKEKDLSFADENSILTNLEYERKVRDEYIEPKKRLDPENIKADHSLSIGVTIPFFGDDTDKMLKLSGYTEKKYKLAREIRTHETEFKTILDQTLRQLTIIKSKQERENRTIKKIKEQALNKLSFNEYSQALVYEFDHEIENQETLKEVYTNYLFIAKEYGDLNPESLSGKL